MPKTIDAEIPVDRNLVACCGLYCGACRAYLKGKCKGCRENAKATWCKVRQCCQKHNYLSCADCQKDGIESCNKFNNPIATVFSYLFKSDRKACIAKIKTDGYEKFSIDMAQNRLQSIRKEKHKKN